MDSAAIPERPRATPSTARRVASIVLGLATVGLAVWFVLRDPGARSALGEVGWLQLLALVGLMSLHVLAESMRHRALLPGRWRGGVGGWRWHGLTAVSRLGNMVVPQAGSAYRAARLRIDHGMPVTTFYASLLAYSIVGMGTALLLAGIAVVMVNGTVGFALAGIGIVILATAGLLPVFLSRFSRRAEESRRTVRLLWLLADGFHDRDQPSRVWRTLAFTVIAQLPALGAYLLAVRSLGADEPVLVGGLLYAVTMSATVVSVTPGGIGITELLAALTGSLADVGAGWGVAAALLIRVTGTAAAVILLAAAAVADRSGAPRGQSPRV